MEQKARRLARQTVGGSKDKVKGNQEVGDIHGINLASDSGAVPGRAGVFEDSAIVGGDPEKKDVRGIQ